MIVCYRDVWVERITAELKAVFTNPEATSESPQEICLTPYGKEAHFYSRDDHSWFGQSLTV